MPLAHPPGVGTSAGADMFLAVRSARAGDVTGESMAEGHADQIVVMGWNWGMSAQVAAADAAGPPSSRQAGQRRALRQLVVTKRLDAASTKLMSVLATNDVVRTATLTMRKAGEGQQDFFTITLTDARLTNLDYTADEDGNVVEQLSFSFVKIQVEYRPQTKSGGRGGSTTFQDDVGARA